MTKRTAYGAVAAIILLTGCAGGPPKDERSLSAAVEPSLRAAASAAEASRDHRSAVQHLSSILQSRPDDVEAAVALARNLRYSGQAQPAADVIQVMLSKVARTPLLLLELGKDYLAADRVALAVKVLEEARGQAPENWEVHSTLGVAYDSLGRLEEAQASYGRALEFSPNNASVMNNLALSQALGGKLDLALETMSRAADLPTAGVQVRQNLALLLALKGDGTQAERMVRRDLPPDMARTNGELMKALAGSALR